VVGLNGINMNNLLENFEIHDTLNPKLFGDDNKLLPEVRQKLIEIVKYFEDFIQVPIAICDVQLVGSNVSYNYTSTSDLDVHLIANFESLDHDSELLQAIYDMKKHEFNQLHDIKIKGIEVELYIQDVKSNITSNGIYSLCDNEWVKEPKPLKSATKHNTDKERDKWRDIIKQAIASNNYDTISQTINTLYLIRHNSIAVEGEYGKGNQLFKDIRSEGLLRRLKDAAYVAKSKQLSMESLSDGQLVHRFED